MRVGTCMWWYGGTYCHSRYDSRQIREQQAEWSHAEQRLVGGCGVDWLCIWLEATPFCLQRAVAIGAPKFEEVSNRALVPRCEPLLQWPEGCHATTQNAASL